MVQNEWEWTDKSGFDFVDWKKGEPRNVTGINCASASKKNGYWRAENCFKLKPFVCRILNSIETTTTKSTTTTPLTTTVPFTTSSDVTVSPTSPIYYPIMKNCYYGWTYFEQTKSSYCYYPEVNLDWQGGENYCQKIGGHLTSVHSYEEMTLLGGIKFLLGFSNEKAQGKLAENFLKLAGNKPNFPQSCQFSKHKQL